MFGNCFQWYQEDRNEFYLSNEIWNLPVSLTSDLSIKVMEMLIVLFKGRKELN